ncbi:zf-RING-2 multi-domain protein [Pyrenophora tritici-repentis]|nr:zf-RING-2 multi-domain protein [Pyrenophora tritici-repentis]
MSYHPDSTTRDIFIREHIQRRKGYQGICSICQQLYSRRHKLVQISGHPQCHCLFGKNCLLKWLGSGIAASNTCPDCKAVLYNANGDEVNVEEGESGSEDGSEDELTIPARGRPKAFLHTLAYDLTITTLVDDLWTGTWDLVAESRELTPDNATRSRSTTRAQLIMLVLDVWPFGEEVWPAVLERLVVRARKMVQKHRNGEDGGFDAEAELRAEREDVRLAVGYGV